MYRNLLSAAHNQAGAFQLPRSIRDGWPVDTQHLGEQVLSDLQRVVTAVRSRLVEIADLDCR